MSTVKRITRSSTNVPARSMRSRINIREIDEYDDENSSDLSGGEEEQYYPESDSENEDNDSRRARSLEDKEEEPFDLSTRLQQLGINEPLPSPRLPRARSNRSIRIPSEAELKQEAELLPYSQGFLRQLQLQSDQYRKAQQIWNAWRSIENEIDKLERNINKLRQQEQNYEQQLNRILTRINFEGTSEE